MANKRDLSQFKNIVGSIRIDHHAYQNISERLCKALRDTAADKSEAERHVAPICLLILGEPRTGKSCVVKDFLAQFKPQREKEGARQAVVYAVAPPRGTVKALVEQLLRALGDPFWCRGTESAMTQRLHTLLTGVGCRMIIIDEFQHFSDKGQRAQLINVCDWIKNFSELKEWAVVGVGLPRSKAVIDADEQLQERFDQAMVMPEFDWNNDQSRRQFRAILHAFVQELAPFELPDLSQEDMALRIFLATNGRLGLFAKVIDRAVKNAIQDERLKIRVEDLAEAFDRAIWYAPRFPLAGGPFLADIDLCRASSRTAKHMGLAADDDYADRSASVIIKQSGRSNGRVGRKRRVKDEMERAL